MKNLGYYNGRVDEFENMSIPMSDRVNFFGDGVYDATYSRNYKIFALTEHVDRLYNSAKLLDINIGISKDEMKELLNSLVAKMDTDENFVYFQATRGSQPKRDHLFDESMKANIWVHIFPKKIMDVYKRVKLITAEDTRFLHCNIKTLNLIPAVMAAKKASDAGCFETVLHRGDRVTECSHSNVHIIKDGVFRTAPTDNLILPGIARAHIIKACKKLGIPVCEEAFTVTELFDADEVIVSSASNLCIAADEIEGKAVGGKAPEILKRIQDEVLREFMEETEGVEKCTDRTKQKKPLCKPF